MFALKFGYSNFVEEFGPSNFRFQFLLQESDIMIFFENLPILCRNMPPNNLRTPLEQCLGESFSDIPRTKAKDLDIDNLLFIKQLKMIKESLENDKIHDANRTLLSQIVENYFSVLNDDHVVSF